MISPQQSFFIDIFHLVCFSLFSASGCYSPFVLISDLDADGKSEHIIFNERKKLTVSVCREDKCLWRGVPKRWNLWKIMTADVDGDRNKEIILGLRKSTRFFPQTHNCLFVYGWDGNQAFPKWLGSKLSKPFTDFTLTDLDKDGEDELITVEITRDERQCIVIYSWTGFGFAVDKQYGKWDEIKIIKVNTENIIVKANNQRRVVNIHEVMP